MPIAAVAMFACGKSVESQHFHVDAVETRNQQLHRPAIDVTMVLYHHSYRRLHPIVSFYTLFRRYSLCLWSFLRNFLFDFVLFSFNVVIFTWNYLFVDSWIFILHFRFNWNSDDISMSTSTIKKRTLLNYADLFL